ncbi:ABC transporter ATP-binding protein [Paracoccus gahaiensis]|uniref:Spermidine/putrescine import ATP-binding protein PotA n=1 Tax=Paracoccus gahaiensis TaxID=1706839 RepID=A0A4U0R808_9RHOB|nr:ABC transporter ATP-binding protein [Paracoccus gahaiensis]TJZ91231.1 ABC transporter ATP-binding protein [Paracoccus gahaiensis]
MSGAPFLRIQNLSKRFGTVSAVDDVSLHIAQGELFCLLGGSGSGKSTLLRMLAGFEEVTSGSISIDGQDMTAMPPDRRPTNMMFQSYALFPHLSVERNIAYGLHRDCRPRVEIRDRVAEMLALVQMAGFGGRKPDQLSGGQRQRVALARALVKKPRLLLLDEPLGALDKKLREETQMQLLDIQRALGITFLIVTHDQDEAMTLSSRVGVMTDGRIVQTGTPREVYEYPQSRFVAGFIGQVNLFEGRITQDEVDHVEITCATTGARIMVAHGMACTMGQPATVAIRPERITLSRARLPDLPNRLTGTVEGVGYLGNLSVYRVAVAGGTLLLDHPNDLFVGLTRPTGATVPSSSVKRLFLMSSAPS